ncbi:MAG: hypothetical protein HYT13_03015 [Candidatus Liptonbacteria bacterium]|nr:hypothetical protein [Candidatus Liptonbacteria bacterium]
MKLKHLAAIFAFTIFVAFAILYYTAFYEPSSEEDIGTAFSPTIPKSEGSRVAIGIKDQKTLVLSWQNLPTGTSRIDVFRARLACENWSKWKTTAIEDPNQGSVEIKIYENLSSGYCIYFEAISRSGEALWSSTPLNQIAYLGSSTPPPQGQTSGPGTPSEPLSSTSQSEPTSTSTETQTTSTTTETTSTTTETTSTSTETTSTTTESTSTVLDIVHTENFWVEHVNQRIEIGWQNMPSGTDKIVVSRSVVSEGLWKKLFEQQGPFENKPYVIRLLDETIDSPQYYKLEALSSSGAILQTFGPLLLPALGQ